ncbi:MAG TPA: DUF3011 domain-containing protein [Bdellovibrionales bacterium]|nr:DUF3011 domain-containing protein [Bdellovibrionales bacterium]
MRILKTTALLIGLTFGATAFADELDSQQPFEMFAIDESLTADADVTEIGPLARVYVRCISRYGETRRCYVPGRVRSVRLINQLSFQPCIAGRTFAAARNYMFVRRGCGGDFLVDYRRR